MLSSGSNTARKTDVLRGVPLLCTLQCTRSVSVCDMDHLSSCTPHEYS